MNYRNKFFVCGFSSIHATTVTFADVVITTALTDAVAAKIFCLRSTPFVPPPPLVFVHPPFFVIILTNITFLD